MRYWFQRERSTGYRENKAIDATFPPHLKTYAQSTESFAMFKSNRLQLAMWNLEAFAVLMQLQYCAWSIHTRGNYKTDICRGRTKASALWNKIYRTLQYRQLHPIHEAWMFGIKCFAD